MTGLNSSHSSRDFAIDPARYETDMESSHHEQIIFFIFHFQFQSIELLLSMTSNYYLLVLIKGTLPNTPFLISSCFRHSNFLVGEFMIMQITWENLKLVMIISKSQKSKFVNKDTHSHFWRSKSLHILFFLYKISPFQTTSIQSCHFNNFRDLGILLSSVTTRHYFVRANSFPWRQKESFCIFPYITLSLSLSHSHPGTCNNWNWIVMFLRRPRPLLLLLFKVSLS